MLKMMIDEYRSVVWVLYAGRSMGVAPGGDYSRPGGKN